MPLLRGQGYALCTRHLLAILFIELSDVHHGFPFEHTDTCLPPVQNKEQYSRTGTLPEDRALGLNTEEQG